MNTAITLIVAIIFKVSICSSQELIVISGNSSLGEYSSNNLTSLFSNTCKDDPCYWLDLYPDSNGTFEAVLKYDINTTENLISWSFNARSRFADNNNRYSIDAIYTVQTNSSYDTTSSNFSIVYNNNNWYINAITNSFIASNDYYLRHENVVSDQVLYIFIRSNSTNAKPISIAYPYVGLCFSENYDGCWNIAYPDDGNLDGNYERTNYRGVLLTIVGIGLAICVVSSVIIGFTIYGIDRLQKKRDERQKADSYHVMSEKI